MIIHVNKRGIWCEIRGDEILVVIFTNSVIKKKKSCIITQTKYLPLGLLDSEDAGITVLRKVVKYLPSEQKKSKRFFFSPPPTRIKLDKKSVQQSLKSVTCEQKHEANRCMSTTICCICQKQQTLCR